ncbi:MAG: AI-2E family transporter [Gammaproteobacteria bacterium]|nr:AI-2E family transporter [Gammaproteobacteria bacterium]
MRLITDWFKTYFSNPQVVMLVLILVVGFAVVISFGDRLAPVLAAVVLAYLLEGLVNRLHSYGLPRMLAVLLVFIFFITFVLFAVLGLLPMLSRQATQLVAEVPSIVGEVQELLLRLPEQYPKIISEAQVNEVTFELKEQITELGRAVLSASLSSVVGVITLLVYLILVPLLVFFFLKDKDRIISWGVAFLPRDRSLVSTVWHDVDRQIGNYVRGKFWEILIVWWVTYITFIVLGLNFAMLLAVLVGVSVLVPYIGAAMVTIPVAVVAYLQWGVGPDFYYVIGAYLVIQALDGNALVPLLFSEVVNLHPVAIIVAVLVFGGLWGFWGVFFAIPLATLVQAVQSAWPRPSVLEKADPNKHPEAVAP